MHFEILTYNRTHALAVNVDRVSPLPVVGDFLFWLVIFFGLVLLFSCSLVLETSDRVKWDSLIAKGFIFEASSQSLKRRKAEKMEI